MAAGFKTATVNASSVPSTQTNFPSYVDLSRLGITTLAEAQSVRVYADSSKTTEWAREIVSAAEMHVKVPSLTSTVSMYVDWDGTSSDYAVTDTYGRNAVWSAYAYVYHFEHTSGNATDSTANGNTLTNTNTVGYTTSGKLGSAANGGSPNTSKYFVSSTMNVALSTSDNYYQSFWMKPTASKNTQMVFAGDGATEFRTGTRTSDKMWLTRYNGTSAQYREISVNYDDGNWRLVHTTVAGTTLQGYVDGAALGTALTVSGYNGSGANTLKVGGLPAYGDEYFTGLIDEVRIAQFAPSANWITTEYNNQSAESTFWGTWSDVGGGGANTTNFFIMA